MKVIIPVAGFGTRLRPHTLTKPKVLLNVGGKPMIHYIIEQLIKDKIATSIVMITGFLGDMIKDYLDSTFKFNFSYLVQDEPKGLGHAVYCAKSSFQQNDETLIILGDTLFDVDLKKLVNNRNSVIGVKKVEDPRRFGVVEKNSSGIITRFVEKPSSPKVSKSNEAIVGLYYLKNSDTLFSSLEYVMENNITVKGEFQLTDALQHMLSKKEKMTTYYVDGWLDCGKPETLLETNRYILSKRPKKKISASNSTIIHPVFIGKDVVIERSVIGPNATINDGCRITNSIIENSVIEKSCNIQNAILNESIVGESAIISNNRNALNLGSHSELTNYSNVKY
jgi:glucose-1-phosphate thymidylyltransferase